MLLLGSSDPNREPEHVCVRMAEASSKRQHFQGKAPVTATTKSPQPSTSTASANNVVSVDTAVSVLMGAR